MKNLILFLSAAVIVSCGPDMAAAASEQAAAAKAPTFAELKKQVSVERGRLEKLRRRQKNLADEYVSMLNGIEQDISQLEASLDRAEKEEKSLSDRSAALERKNERLAKDIERLKAFRQQLLTRQEKLGQRS
jgi:Skp family chaperone for outer membrane proteins